jgi:DNA-binding NtrC family response regulator
MTVEQAGAPLILIADDDEGIRTAAERVVKRCGFRVATAVDGRDALEMIAAAQPAAALVDLQMPHVGGLEVLRTMRQASPACQVILMTAQPTMESAIEAVKLGARDYITKPFDLERLEELLASVREGLDRRRDAFAKDREAAECFEYCGMIGRSRVMQELFDTIRRLAPHVRTALVTGETGSGKELVARALHKAGSRRDKRFIAYNCSAVVESLFESEFFGHARGAFTGATDAKAGLFETADGGTLFLDELGELPLAMQAKLLRVVEYGEVQRVGTTDPRKVDVRIVAATNRNLEDEVAAGRFRQDLFYRFNIVQLALPPLRERAEDIPYITAAAVKEFSKRMGKPIVGLTAGAEHLLQKSPWPGNVRELRNALERACMLADNPMLAERDILVALGSSKAAATGRDQRPAASAARTPSAEVTRDAVASVLEQVGGNRSEAARLLGLSRRAFYRRLDSFGLR